MNVLVRSKRGEKLRRRRDAYRGPGEQQSTSPEAAQQAAGPASEGTHRTAEPVAHRHGVKVRPPAAVAHGEVRREHGRCSGKPLTNDQAVYSCQCGFVFEAPVSTSVGCPHCGSTQAW